MIVKYKKGNEILKFEVPDGARRCLDVKDIDGKEIYEGDWLEKIIDGKQYLYQAHDCPGAENPERGLYLWPKLMPTARIIA